jgi:hypothetical protein
MKDQGVLLADGLSAAAEKGGLRRVPLAARQKSFYPWLRDESM